MNNHGNRANVRNLARQFEVFAGDLFEALGLIVQHTRGPVELYDLSALATTRVFAIEVKLYRSLRVTASIIHNAALHLRAHRQSLGSKVPVLFTTAFLSSKLRAEIKETYGVEAIGFAEIKATLRALPRSMESAFNAIIDEAQIFTTPPIVEIVPSEHIAEILDLQAELNISAQAAVETVEVLPGEEHASRLEKINCGRAHASDYERECIAALRLLFSEHLTGWSPQSTTSTGLHRFDLIARVSSEDDFWKALVSDFRSRYVIFEFKNYCEEISQGQVYTTEKYLYPAAMRGAAIVISQKGPDHNALEASRGALRENGKVILHIKTDDLCKMLRGFDNGENPSDTLADHLYETLRRLDR